ncbi:hypothetical protein QUB60_21105 [Microcoleus sp. A2-C5]
MKINIANLSPLAQPPQQTFFQIRPKPIPVRDKPELSSLELNPAVVFESFGRTYTPETGFLPIFLVTQPKFSQKPGF